jgi:hypothetical protein
MLDRDRRSLREFREQEAERERLEREEQERPIRELTAELNQTHRRLAQIEREYLTGTVPDPERYLDPVVGPDVRMSASDAREFNGRQAELYAQSHPELYKCQELVDLVNSYFAKESIQIVTAAMLERLINRFADAGLLPERPVEPEPDPVVEPEILAEPVPETYEGIDPSTGEQRTYSAWQVDRMSSDEYRRVFRLTRADVSFPAHAAF